MKKILSFAHITTGLTQPENKTPPPVTPTAIGKQGHARKPSKDKISDEDYETREKRISNIVAMSKTPSSHRRTKSEAAQKELEKQEELEKNDEELGLRKWEEQEEKERKRSSSESSRSPPNVLISSDLSESSSSLSGLEIKEAPKVETADILLRNSQSSRAQFKNQVYSFADKEKDFHLERSNQMNSKSEPILNETNTNPQKPPFNMSQSVSVASKTNNLLTSSLDIGKNQTQGNYKSSGELSSYTDTQESPRERPSDSPKDRKEKPLMSRNSVPTITIGYANSSDQIRTRSNSSPQVQNFSKSLPVIPDKFETPNSGRSSPETDEEDDRMMIEVLAYLRQLSDEEKCESGLILSEIHPGILRIFRNKLRESLKKKWEAKLQKRNDNTDIDWNARFQSLIEDLDSCEENSKERMQVYANLAKLASDFIYCAKTYGKLIISEMYLPHEEKTVKPTSVGGALGGLKYVVKNILFKFAVDHYGLFEDDEHAAKVAAHDLRGLIQYYNANIPGLHFPLMALVNFMGFRLQALSLLPISHDTLVYGTSDGGRSIRADNHKFNAKMRLAAEKLNLKPHIVGLSKISSKFLYSCADMEGHHGSDGRFYTIDFSRAFPPIDPDKVFKNAHLFRLFRPEFVKKYKIPLCPDTYSGFVANFQADEHIQEIREATDHLYTKVIPEYANELNERKNENINQATMPIKESLHKKGINLSLMGVLRQHLNDESPLKSRLLVEMVARTARHVINEKLRIKMKEIKTPSQQPFKICLTEYLNLLFGNTKLSHDYWNGDLRKKMLVNFCFALTDRESSDTYDLKAFFDNKPIICTLYQRLSKLSRFTFSPKLHRDFCENPASFNFKKPFDDTDMEELQEGIKHTNIVSLATGYYFKERASLKNGDESLRLLGLAREKFLEAIESNPEDKLSLRELAYIEGDKVQAGRHYEQAIEADPTDSISLLKYAIFLEEYDAPAAEDHYLKSLENNPYEETTLRSYADFLRKRGDNDQAERFYELARRQSKVASMKEEEVWENRRRPVFSQEFSADFLLPTDHRGAWSSKDGVPKGKDDVKLPKHWEWVDEWTIDILRPGVDEQGWEYAFSWNSATWTSGPGPLTYVSRRRWKRTRRNALVYQGEDEEVDSIAIDDVIKIMRESSSELQIKDRYWYLKCYPQCFVGSEAVDFFRKTYSLSRKQAIKLGNKLLTNRRIAHVENQHLFSDAYLFYKFLDPDEVHEVNAAALDQIVKEGYLEKMGAIVKSWKKRYCILKKGTLYYFALPHETVPRGVISLVQASVLSAHQAKLNLGSLSHTCFVIRTGRRSYVLKSKDSTEKEDWMKAIEENCM